MNGATRRFYELLDGAKGSVSVWVGSQEFFGGVDSLSDDYVVLRPCPLSYAPETVRLEHISAFKNWDKQ